MLKKLLIIIPLFFLCSCYPVSTDTKGKEASSKGRTLEVVKNRGKLICGVNAQLPGFGYLSPTGRYEGFDIEFCRAFSAALFDSPDQVEFRPLTAKERFTALQTGEIDILVRNTTWTLTRETELGINFLPVTFYDGQGMMVKTASGITTLEELNGATIGVTTGTTTELNLADTMATQGLTYTPVVFETGDELFDAYQHGRIDAMTADKSILIARRLSSKTPSDSYIFKNVLSKEPLAPLVRQGDDEWRDLISWIIFVTINGEELGIRSDNVEELYRSATDPRVKKLLGSEGNMGIKIGLRESWALDVIKHVGNYEEIYNRTLGSETKINLPRRLNRLYTKGGILYSPPFR